LKIKSLLSMTSSMFKMAHKATNIFFLLSLDFLIIIVDNYRICLWVFEC
jgi:hypothetical protein